MTTLTDTDTLVLKRSKLFASLGEADLRYAVQQCRRRIVLKGQTILTEGEPGESMLIIVFGEVAYKKGDKQVGTDSSGSFFGELSMLGTGGTRAVSVVALDDCVLLELYKTEFETIVHKYPDVGLVAIRSMAERLKQTRPQSLLKNKSSVVIVGVLVAGTAKLLSHYLPKELAGETATLVVNALVEYSVPVFSGLALFLKHVEIKTLRQKLFS